MHKLKSWQSHKPTYWQGFIKVKYAQKIIFLFCVLPMNCLHMPEKYLQWFATVSLFLCSLSRVWWFFLLLMDYFDKLLLTAPLKNYRNMFSLSYLFHNICLTVNFYRTQVYTGSDLWSMGHRLNWMCIVHLYNWRFPQIIIMWLWLMRITTQYQCGNASGNTWWPKL